MKTTLLALKINVIENMYFQVYFLPYRCQFVPLAGEQPVLSRRLHVAVVMLSISTADIRRIPFGRRAPQGRKNRFRTLKSSEVQKPQVPVMLFCNPSFDLLF
jgi:hypothetical protein